MSKWVEGKYKHIQPMVSVGPNFLEPVEHGKNINISEKIANIKVSINKCKPKKLTISE